MIGIIGPTNSVIRAKSVASGLRLADLVLLRTYVTWDTVPQLAAELDPACTVLLFTGRVPYTIARNRGGLQAALDFIPHDGADLFRALIRVLRDNAGRLPPASLDTIDRSAVEETYLDLDLQPPSALLTLDEAVRAPAKWRASDVTAFHEERYRRGEVELCLTCTGPVHDELGRRGVPVVRVDHTRAALREALRRASLTDRLARTEASQIAVAVVDVREDGRRGPRPDPYEAQRDELRLRARVLDLAERLQGTLSRASDGSYLVHTTRGAVMAELSALDPQGGDGLGSGDSLSTGTGSVPPWHALRRTPGRRPQSANTPVDRQSCSTTDRARVRRPRAAAAIPASGDGPRSNRSTPIGRSGSAHARTTRHRARQLSSTRPPSPCQTASAYGSHPARPFGCSPRWSARASLSRQVGSPRRPTADRVPSAHRSIAPACRGDAGTRCHPPASTVDGDIS